MRVAVVGCGVGGMAAAIALSRRGHAVTLLEAFETPHPLGSGLLLQPTGLAALRAMGLEEAAHAAGARVDRLTGRDTRGRLVMNLEYDHWRAGSHGVGIHRASLFGLLFDTLAPAGVTLKTGVRVAAIEDPGRPVLHDDQGRSHGPFDLAVIADGSASKLREQVRPRARAPLYPWGAAWANLPDPDGQFTLALNQLYHRAEVMIGVLPIGQAGGDTPLVSLFWSLPPQGAEAFFSGDFEAWKDRVRGLWPQTAPLLAHLPDAGHMLPALYRDVIVGQWNTGATVLIGDAAHATSPQLGQGANLALVDAVELADHLQRDSRPIAVSLTAYQAARRRHAGLYQLASKALTPLFQSKGRFWALVRDTLFTPFAGLPGFRYLGALLLTGALRLGRWPDASRP